MNNHLKFEEDGKSFHFVFSDGTESPDNYESKESGLEAALDLLDGQEIDLDEFFEMQQKIYEAENLPLENEENKDSENFISALNSIMAMLYFPAFIFYADKKDSEPVVTVAYFEKCDCDKNHGVIYCRNGNIATPDNKEYTLEMLEELQDLQYVSTSEYEKVKKEIEDAFV